MARQCFNNNANFGNIASAVVSSVPLTLSCWVWMRPVPSGSPNGWVFFSVNNTAGQDGWMLATDNATPPNIQALVEFGGSFTNAQATGGSSNQAWHHVCGVFTSNTSRTIYLDGANSATDTTAAALTTTPDRTQFFIDGALSNTVFGSVCEFAIWNIALASSDVAQLAEGIPASLVQPSSLKGYWPFYGLASPETDLSSGGNTVTLNGSLPPSDHAPIVQPAFVFTA